MWSERMNAMLTSSGYLGHILNSVSRELEVDPCRKIWVGSRISMKQDDLTGHFLKFRRSKPKKGGLFNSEKGPRIVGGGSGQEFKGGQFKGVSCRPTPRGLFSFLVAPSTPSITCTSGCLVSPFLEWMRMGWMQFIFFHILFIYNIFLVTYDSAFPR